MNPNEAFARLHEDPMLMIRKREQAAREQVLKNPVKMGRIHEDVRSRLGAGGSGDCGSSDSDIGTYPQ